VGPQGELQNIHFSPDSKTIAVSRWYQARPEEVEDHTIWLLDLSDLKQRPPAVKHFTQIIERQNGSRSCLRKKRCFRPMASDSPLRREPRSCTGISPNAGSPGKSQAIHQKVGLQSGWGADRDWRGRPFGARRQFERRNDSISTDESSGVHSFGCVFPRRSLVGHGSA